MSEANKAIARRWFKEVWNHGRDATIDELVHDHCLGHGLGDTEADTHGPAEFKLIAANLRGAIPDIHIYVDDILGRGRSRC